MGVQEPLRRGYLTVVTSLEERRDWLRYTLLAALADAPPHTLPLDYRRVVPDTDDFELRGAASWLVENGYARWATSGYVTITGAGRQQVQWIRDADRRASSEADPESDV